MPDWRSLYPFESHEIRLGEWRYHYVDEGTRSQHRGEPLLMVHGNPTWSFYWRNILLGLRDEYRAIAVDHIGCGLSDKPQDYPYTLEQHVDNLVTFIHRLDLRNITLLAHDWGGAIGLGAAERLKERFARIILFNTGAYPPFFIPKRIAVCKAPMFGTVAIRGFNAFAKAALSMATEKPERMTPAVRAGLLAPYDSWHNRIANDKFVKDIPLSPRHPTWDTLEAIEAGLSSLADRPIGLLWGMRDWCFTPACLERFLRHWPQAEVEKYEDAGHYVVEDAHERIVPWVRGFLSRHPLP
jgi:cis-3-alkyl-4-acyloxetan-2-one decarboxylase